MKLVQLLVVDTRTILKSIIFPSKIVQ